MLIVFKLSIINDFVATMTTRKSSKKYNLHAISTNKTLKTPWQAL
jgi:hypothetical protein